ncbi:MAG: hypothetical protein QXP91_03355 [Candidatus Methanomethylicia archaeon]
MHYTVTLRKIISIFMVKTIATYVFNYKHIEIIETIIGRLRIEMLEYWLL